MAGNTYGSRHVKYKLTDDRFWDFSFDEMAAHDLPAMLYYILNETHQETLFYVGHSQGTLIGFSQFSLDEELASRVKLFLGLGPVATMSHMKSPIKYIADLGISSNQQIFFKLFGKRSFLPTNGFEKWLADKACNSLITDKIFCENIMFILAGPSDYLNKTRLAVYTTHAPAGTSVKNLAHFAQSVISGQHQMYDYGSGKENFAHYNQTTAPLYHVQAVKMPVALYYANNDWLADPQDVNYLRKNLPNIVDDFEISDWNHLDFLWATNANTRLYERMIKLMKKYL